MKGLPAATGMNLTSRGLWVLAVAWTLVAGGSLAWNLNLIKEHAFAEAKAQATSIYHKDIEYRRWNAGHGGVYVPITEKTQPNPYLSHLPDRDVTTSAGRKLTLMNPAFMTRQVHELMEGRVDGSRGHITSLMPVRPGNKADPWEEVALKKFEEGESEAFSIEKMEDGKKYFRYMHSMVVEQRCLKCHAVQGYQLGDIRGGISVSVPVEKLMAGVQEETIASLLGHGSLWLLGLGAIFVGGRRQVNAELAVRKNEARIRLLLDSSLEAIYGLDTQGNCTFANPACLKVLGYEDTDEVLGKNMHDLMHHTRSDGSPYPVHECRIFEAFVKSETTHVDDEVLWRKDGTSFAAEYWSHPTYEDDKVTGSVVSFWDITERKRSEEELRLHLDELERFQSATIDREFRIKELRDEIAALKKGKE